MEFNLLRKSLEGDQRGHGILKHRPVEKQSTALSFRFHFSWIIKTSIVITSDELYIPFIRYVYGPCN